MCSIRITDFTFVEYREKSDWSEDAIATFTGCAYAETNCKALKATLGYYSDDYTNKLAEVHVSQDITTETVENTYCFKNLDVAFPNLKGHYGAILKVYNDA